MRTSLDHERLDVYQMSLRFITWTLPLLEKLPPNAAVRNQLDRASTSIPLNIAEGNGKFTGADRCRFFDNARGSAVECSACLDVTVAKQFMQTTEVADGKALCVQMVSMLYGMIRANSDVRLFEKPPVYGAKENRNSNKNRKEPDSRSRAV
jgi:four helix bundle protein